MQARFGVTGLGRALTMITTGAFNVSYLASLVIIVGMVARLPMVAGWDRLLPRWWSALHPSFRTPSKKIGAVTEPDAPGRPNLGWFRQSGGHPGGPRCGQGNW